MYLVCTCTNTNSEKKTQSAFYTVVLLRAEVARQHKHLRDHVTEKVQEIVELHTALAPPQRDGKRGEKKIPKTIWTLSLQTSHTEKNNSLRFHVS